MRTYKLAAIVIESVTFIIELVKMVLKFVFMGPEPTKKGADWILWPIAVLFSYALGAFFFFLAGLNITLNGGRPEIATVVGLFVWLLSSFIIRVLFRVI